MYFKRMTPENNHARVDRAVISDTKLSDGAFRLYSFLFGLYASSSYTEAYLMKALGISRRSVANRKRELKNADLLCIDQIAPRVYCAYLGTKKYPASKVMVDMKTKDLILPEDK